MTLVDLVFSDLFVADTAATSWFKATPDSMVANPVPDACAEELQRFRHALDARKESNAFRIQWPEETGLRLRVQRLTIAYSQVIYVVRRYRLVPKSMADLGMPANIGKQLLAPELKDGLVVFLGKAGSGKTTTASTFIVERLHNFGGVCWTVENPIEIPMQGQHGRGWCYQTEVSNDKAMGLSIAPLMRATPNIIFIGELLDSMAVREAVKAATSGHLVVATFHASDLLSGIARLALFAGDEIGGGGLADSLRVAVHLSLHNAEPGGKLPGAGLTAPDAKGTGTPPRVLSVEPLWIQGATIEALRTTIRDKEFHMLKSEVERQKRGFVMGRLPS